MSTAIDLYIAALSKPDENTLAVLAPVLADDVRAAGVFGSGTGRDAVLASTAAPLFPFAGSASWAEPVVDGDRVTVHGTFPAGMPVAGVDVTARVVDGRLVELTQELEPAAPPPPTDIHLTEAMTATIGGALANKTPVIVAYVDGDGVPHVSPRGSVQVAGADQLAMWIRDPGGGLLRGIAANPHVGLFYRDAATRVAYTFTGRAHAVDDPAERARVYEGAPLNERNLDPVGRGVAVVVDVDEVTGNDAGGRINMRRR